MSNLEQLETQIKGLNAEELKTFREWFKEFDAEVWDRQIDADSKRGVLDALANRALADHEVGRSTNL